LSFGELLIQQCRWCRFWAYECQWTGLNNKGRKFIMQLVLGQLARRDVLHIQSEIHLGRSSGFCRNESYLPKKL
jgi:hypothetical protein